jgi:hypothetical protein
VRRGAERAVDDALSDAIRYSAYLGSLGFLRRVRELGKPFYYSLLLTPESSPRDGTGRSIRSGTSRSPTKIVLEELLANPLIYRDFFASGASGFFIFDERVEMISPGRLPNNHVAVACSPNNSHNRSDNSIDRLLVEFPTSATKRLGWSVKRVAARAKLVTRRPLTTKCASLSSSARLSPYGLLVICQSTNPSRSATAGTMAGRSLDSEVSENGNGSSTSDPVKDATRQHPPLAGSNFRPTSVR